MFMYNVLVTGLHRHLLICYSSIVPLPPYHQYHNSPIGPYRSIVISHWPIKVNEFWQASGIICTGMFVIVFIQFKSNQIIADTLSDRDRFRQVVRSQGSLWLYTMVSHCQNILLLPATHSTHPAACLGRTAHRWWNLCRKLASVIKISLPELWLWFWQWFW